MAGNLKYSIKGVLELNGKALKLKIPAELMTDINKILDSIATKYTLNSLSVKKLMLSVNLVDDPAEISLYLKTQSNDGRVTGIPLLTLKHTKKAVSITTTMKGFQESKINKLTLLNALDLMFDIISIVDNGRKVSSLKYIMKTLIKDWGMLNLFSIHPSITIGIKENDEGSCYPVLIDNNTGVSVHGDSHICHPIEVIGLLANLVVLYSKELSENGYKKAVKNKSL